VTVRAHRPPGPPPQLAERTRTLEVEIDYREHDDPNRERSLIAFLADLVAERRRSRGG
jgi:hypothetical protein